MIVLKTATASEESIYISLVFLPELASLAFLTGAYITELSVLITIHHRVVSSVKRIGQVRYAKELKRKKFWYSVYSFSVIAMYIILGVVSIRYNT